jgi:hypothetical protein
MKVGDTEFEYAIKLVRENGGIHEMYSYGYRPVMGFYSAVHRVGSKFNCDRKTAENAVNTAVMCIRYENEQQKTEVPAKKIVFNAMASGDFEQAGIMSFLNTALDHVSEMGNVSMNFDAKRNEWSLTIYES